jgi:Fe-S oxidoreductase
MNGSLPAEMFTGKELHDVLDLCLECKGCKSECPSQVDMAKMKSEFLFHYQERNGYSLRSHLFAHVDAVGRIGSALAPVSNWLMGTALSKWAMDRLGVAKERTLPPFSRDRFSKWMRLRRRSAKGSRGQVALFNDTYMEYNYPHLGRDAVEVLEHLGYEVVVPPRACCGRPAISKGFLRQAKDKAGTLVDVLHPYAKAGIPILGLEPSCILTVKDDYPDLVPGEKTEAVSRAGATLDEFLSREMKSGALCLPKDRKEPYLVHVHCYQKALGASSCTSEVLQSVTGGTVV